MKKTRKIRFILEATIEQETAFTPEAVRRLLIYENLESYINSDEWQEIVRQNQVMLDTILADPKMVQLLLLQDLQARMVDEPMLIFRLAGYDTGKKTWPGFDALESLVPAMPAHARGFFQAMKCAGLFQEHTELVSASTEMVITSVRVEEVS